MKLELNMNHQMLQQLLLVLEHIPSDWAMRREAVKSVEWEDEQIIRVEFSAAHMIRVHLFGEDDKCGWALDCGSGYTVFPELN